MGYMLGPILFGWSFALACGAFVMAQVYLASGRSVLCVALWHGAFNTLVSSEVNTGWLAGIVSTAGMVWGVVVAVRWWRAPPLRRSLDPSLAPVTPGFDIDPVNISLSD